MNAEQINEKQKVACSYHFMMKGVNNGRILHQKRKADYREEDDFDVSSFGVDYEEYERSKEQMEKEINELEDSVDDIQVWKWT